MSATLIDTIDGVQVYADNILLNKEEGINYVLNGIQPLNQRGTVLLYKNGKLGNATCHPSIVGSNNFRFHDDIIKGLVKYCRELNIKSFTITSAVRYKVSEDGQPGYNSHFYGYAIDVICYPIYKIFELFLYIDKNWPYTAFLGAGLSEGSIYKNIRVTKKAAAHIHIEGPGGVKLFDRSLKDKPDNWKANRYGTNLKGIEWGYVNNSSGYQVLSKNGIDGYNSPPKSKLFGNVTYGELLNVVKKNIYDKENKIDLAKFNIPDLPIGALGTSGQIEQYANNTPGKLFNGFALSTPSIIELGG